MPRFECLSRQGGAPGTGPEGKPRAVLREYMGYIEQIDPGHAGKLTAAEGESTAAIRRRLGAAAQLLGRSLEVTRDGRGVYFWEGEEARPRRRGRPRRSERSG